MERPSLLLLSLLVVAFSSQIHARESKFFSKTTRLEVSPTSIAQEPSPSGLALPPQSHNGYGLYAHDDPDPSSTKTTTMPTSYNLDSSSDDNAYEEPISNPSSFANAEFSAAQNAENSERNYYNNNDQTYEKKVSNNPYYGSQDRYGMSDTRFMENGKNVYGVDEESYDEPMKNSAVKPAERSYGSYANSNYGENTGNRNNGYGEYKNDLEAYLNSNENQESEMGFYDP